MEESIRKVVLEELRKIITIEDSIGSVGSHEAFEASVSSALSFMQDIQGSANKIKSQIELGITNKVVDSHLQQAYKHVNEAKQSYFKTLQPNVREEVVQRLGEVNIDGNEY